MLFYDSYGKLRDDLKEISIKNVPKCVEEFAKDKGFDIKLTPTHIFLYKKGDANADSLYGLSCEYNFDDKFCAIGTFALPEGAPLEQAVIAYEMDYFVDNENSPFYKDIWDYKDYLSKQLGVTDEMCPYARNRNAYIATNDRLSRMSVPKKFIWDAFNAIKAVEGVTNARYNGNVISLRYNGKPRTLKVNTQGHICTMGYEVGGEVPTKTLRALLDLTDEFIVNVRYGNDEAFLKFLTEDKPLTLPTDTSFSYEIQADDAKSVKW